MAENQDLTYSNIKMPEDIDTEKAVIGEILSDEECILVFEEDGKEISCQLDLSTEAVIRKYETGLHGIPAGDYLCYLEGNRLNVYNYKNEGKKMSVNIENLWEMYA